MRRSARALLPAALAASLVLAACTAAGGSPGPSGSAGPSSGGSDGGGNGRGIAHPTGSDLVFRLDHVGGFMIPNAALLSPPTFTLVGDGRVIVPGAQIEIFPGPALPAMNVRQLNEAGIQAVLDEVARTGMFAGSSEWRGAQNFVADASDAIFTMHADNREAVVSVYGLGTLPPGDTPPNFPAAELPVHAKLSALAEKLTNLDPWLPASAWVGPEWLPYQPDSLRLVVRNADEDAPDDSGIEPQELDWPVAGDPAAFGEQVFDGTRCGVVSGEDAQSWYAALADANQLTRWLGGGHRYEVSVRLLLPDEPQACPAVG